MSEHSAAGSRYRLHLPMRSRRSDEAGRVASPLELLFDLTFVVAVASITTQLAHGISGGHVGEVLLPLMMVFFAIWWAWMNFTWFASAFDVDDVLYRVLALVQMAGVLVLAAGVPAAFGSGDFFIVTMGYLVMRIGLVAMWIRAAIAEPTLRRVAIRYAVGVTVVQVLWILRLVAAEAGLLPLSAAPLVFLVLVVLELAVPVWSEWRATTHWHPHHMAERYGLFTIILLGESVLATSNGVAAGIANNGLGPALIAIAFAGLVVLFAVWWLYFLEPTGENLEARRTRSFVWGYGHYFLFASLAAMGAGFEVAVEQTGDHVTVPAETTALALAIPTAAAVILIPVLQWFIAARFEPRWWSAIVAAALVLASAFAAPLVGVPVATVVIAVICVAHLAVSLVLGARTEKHVIRRGADVVSDREPS